MILVMLLGKDHATLHNNLASLNTSKHRADTRAIFSMPWRNMLLRLSLMLHPPLEVAC